MEDIVYNRYEFTTLITTIDYACGIVCLAQSLLLGSYLLLSNYKINKLIN